MSVSRWRVVALAFWLTGCAAQAPPYDPFKIDKQTFRDRVHTIALMPLGLPSDVQNPDAIRAKFENLIAGRLQQFGFATLSSRKAGDIFERARTDAGGAFDPITGKVDEAKSTRIRKTALDEIAKQYHADAVLHMSVIVVKASFMNGVAAWSGTTERIESGGNATVRILGGVSVSGSVPATALGVTVEDMTGNDMYVKNGGIEALSTYGMGGFSPKPIPGLFHDEQKNLKGVDLALKELNPNPGPDKKK